MAFTRPALEDIAVTDILRALSDPARLDTVRRLATCPVAAEQGGLSCSMGMPCAELPKSTRSNHYKVLREAGLVETEKRGREVVNRLRRDELDARFPGLLAAVLAG